MWTVRHQSQFICILPPLFNAIHSFVLQLQGQTNGMILAEKWSSWVGPETPPEWTKLTWGKPVWAQPKSIRPDGSDQVLRPTL